MAQIQHNGFAFQVLDEIQAQYAELVKLVLNTESMDDQEKQYWFDIMPSMTEEQIDRLFDILETERRKLEELEIKYQQEMKKLNETHLIEWQEFQVRESKKKVAEAEAKEKGDKNDAEEMLDMI